MTRLWPTSIVGRTVVVLLLGVVVSNLVGFAFYWTERGQSLASARVTQVAERIASLTQIIEDTPPASRNEFVRDVRTAGFRMMWTRERPLARGQADDPWAESIRNALLELLGDGAEDRLRVALMQPTELPAPDMARGFYGDAGRRMPGMGRGGATGRGTGPASRDRWSPPDPLGPALPERLLVVSVGLGDGSWLNFLSAALPVRPFWASTIFLPMLAATLAVIAISVWAVWRATAPLALFTRAAERLGRDVNAPALDEKGPREVRSAALAFNDMQKRLRTFVEDRTRMLAAISHDLRTPITRMRLRAEFVEDAEQRRKMLDDLNEMEAMIAATLSFAREDAAGEARVPIDLADLLQSLCDAAVDGGHEASYAGPSRLSFTAAPTALKRAFGNLVDNAIKYGRVVRVTLEEAADEVRIAVDDDGPGIPAAEMEKVFTAFYRIDHSRSRETGGVGLGLAVVRTIIRAHGGEVTLANRPGGGLRATVTLPRD